MSTTLNNSAAKKRPLGTRQVHIPRNGPGLGQLTLVEHALCPLDARAALVKNLVFNTQFVFTDANRHAQTAEVKVFCPLGLSTGDEFFLWGLLALTLAQPEAEGTLMATPHYVLRQLGLIDQHARRGGRQYGQFAAAIERLSVVKYQSDKFFDPIRREHRRVSFGFLSYSLPLDDQSDRAWRVVWDPVFFEFTKPLGGHLWFDLATYRELDGASRRLFLFLCKIYARRHTTPSMCVRHLGENILGFSPSLVTRDLKAKVARCVSRLADSRIVEVSPKLFRKQGPGEYSLTLSRGKYFDRRRGRHPAKQLQDSPLFEPLHAIGLDEGTIRRLLRKYPTRLLQEWSDITLAARERFGATFFKRSPQAFFIDNVQHAALGDRTPPDWWQALRKAEREPDDRGEILDRIREEVRGKVPAGPVASSPNKLGQPQRRKQRRLESIRSLLSVHSS
ncbi:MAG: hypothetical protein HY290_04320 [Planctomycetia bacterium]|nr:hypothetical protein [Planctomycetia bacterium]